MNPRTSSRPSMLRNAIANWGAFFYVAVVSFVLSPIIVKSLGSTGYGVWSLLVAVVGYLGLLDFGVRGAVTRYIAHHHAVQDLDSSSRIASAAIALFGGLGLLAVLLSSGLSWLSPVLFNIPPELLSDSRIVLVIGGFTIATSLVSAVYGGIVTGLERFDINSGVEILLTTLRSVAVLVALKSGYGLVTLAVIHLVSSVLYGLLMWATVRRIMPGLRFRFRENLLPHVRTILSFSAYLSAIHILAIVIFYTDTLVIATMLPISAVGFYAIAGNLAEYARKVSQSISKMFTPRVSAMSSAGSHDIVNTVLAGARAATLVTLPIVVTFLFRGERFIDLWMGPEYGAVSGAVLQVFAIVIWVGSARSVAVAAIIGMNLHRRLIPFMAFEALCNLALSIMLARPLGIVGVAIGTLIPGLIVSLILMPRCLRATMGVPVDRYFLEALIRPTLSCIPFAAASYLVEHYWPTQSMLVFFVQIALIVPVAVIGALAFSYNATERTQMMSIVRRRLFPSPQAAQSS